jgi:hypothetical protein
MTYVASEALPVSAKLRLAVRIWRSFLIVRWEMRRHPLPELVAKLGTPLCLTQARHAPHRLSKAVHRCLRIRWLQSTCLIRSLVLYRLLREQGAPAELVIGLPVGATTHEAHAWVELNGKDWGPPPGRGTHLPMARFG